MTAIDAAIRNKLVSDGTISGYVSTRIYFDEIPISTTMPAISVFKVSEVPDTIIPDLYRASVQVSVWSTGSPQNGMGSPAEAETIAAAVVDLLTKTRPEEGVPTAYTAGTSTFSVHRISCTGNRRLKDPVTDWYHVSIDIEVKFRKVS